MVKDFDLILNLTQYLSNTIEQFKEFIKTDRNIKEEVVQEIISSLTKIVGSSLKYYNIELINEIKNKNSIKILSVEGELMQVLLNLINNSKDSLIKNKISDPWIKINALDENKMLTISVEDNGKGIDKEILNKIFNPYFTTKHQSQGTGIGLYMCKKIIEGNLKGKLIANNTEVGAKFIITLQKN